jgi:hypothetical protein
LTPRELARKLIKVSSNGAGWSVRLMDRPRKRDATECIDLDFPTRELSLQMAQIVREVVVAAIRESRRRGGIPTERKDRSCSRVVLSFPPFTLIRRYFDGNAEEATPKRARVARGPGRLLRFPAAGGE